MSKSYPIHVPSLRNLYQLPKYNNLNNNLMRSSSNPESNDYITDTELEDLGISRDLWEDWYLILNFLWVGSQKSYPTQATMGENEILIDNFSITANFVNSGYVEVELSRDQDVFLVVRYENNPEAVVGSVFAILDSLLP